MARAVNFVWNYANETSFDAIRNAFGRVCLVLGVKEYFGKTCRTRCVGFYGFYPRFFGILAKDSGIKLWYQDKFVFLAH